MHQAGGTASANAHLEEWRELAAAQRLRGQELGRGEGAPGTADPLGARICHRPQGEGFSAGGGHRLMVRGCQGLTRKA